MGGLGWKDQKRSEAQGMDEWDVNDHLRKKRLASNGIERIRWLSPDHRLPNHNRPPYPIDHPMSLRSWRLIPGRPS